MQPDFLWAAPQYDLFRAAARALYSDGTMCRHGVNHRHQDNHQDNRKICCYMMLFTLVLNILTQCNSTVFVNKMFEKSMISKNLACGWIYPWITGRNVNYILMIGVKENIIGV